MTFKYTEEQLNMLDKSLLVQLFLGMQDQVEELTRQTAALNDKMQLMMEQKRPVTWMHLNRKIWNCARRKRKSRAEKKPPI